MNVLGSFAFTEANFEDENLEDTEIPVALPVARNRWENDLKCSNCKMNFNIPGLANTQKLKCLFCYRGACARCLAYSKIHPETHEQEKMCKNCFFERKQLVFILGKIEEMRLEKSQLTLEAELAVNENYEFTSARKEIQKEIQRFKQEQSASYLEQQTILNSLKRSNQDLLFRLQGISDKNIEIDEKFHLLQTKHERLQNDLKASKKDLQAKESQENNLKSEINIKKQQQIELLQKRSLSKSEHSGSAETVSELKSEISQLTKLLIELNQINESLEFSLEQNLSKQETNFDVIHVLNSRTRSIIEQPEEEISFYQQEQLDQTEENLKKYDKIIETLEARLSLLKTRESRKISNLNSRLEFLYKQNEFLGNENFKKKNGPARERVSSSSCSNCIIN